MASRRPPDFEQLIAAVARALGDADLPFMLIGGQAVLLHGEARLTQDIDITLGVSPDRLDDILDAREDAWLVQLRHIDAEVLRGSADWILHGVLLEQLEVSIEGRACQRHLWWLDLDIPLGAPHVGELPE